LLKKKKRFKRRNYFRLKKKFFKRKKFSLISIRKKLIIFKLKKLKYIIKNYLKFILIKNNFLLKFNTNNENFLSLFIKLNNIFKYFKDLIIYNRKLYKYFLIYKDYIINKKIVYLRSK
jgi:hypothetical protein